MRYVIAALVLLAIGGCSLMEGGYAANKRDEMTKRIERLEARVEMLEQRRN
jgi:outer membrane murein-binding lipoprotein Lpp